MTSKSIRETITFSCEPEFKTLISTILSQRTRDENSAVASQRLYKVYDTPQKLAEGDLKKVEELIRPAGLYKAKTKHIQDLSRVLIEKYNGKVPKDFNKLMELPGVGWRVPSGYRRTPDRQRPAGGVHHR